MLDDSMLSSVDNLMTVCCQIKIMGNTKKGDLLTDLVLEIFRLNGHLLSEGDRISGEVGLSSARWKVLGAAALSEESLTVAQISKQMGQARQSVQRIADSLVESGFCIWQENPAHKRAKLLKLTKKGQATYSKLEKSQAPWANAAGESLTIEELKSALKALKKLTNWFED